MSNHTINVFGREYNCSCCGRTGFDSADMPSHSSTCRSKVAILIALPRKCMVLVNGKVFEQFQLEFDHSYVDIF